MRIEKSKLLYYRLIDSVVNEIVLHCLLGRLCFFALLVEKVCLRFERRVLCVWKICLFSTTAMNS